MTKDTHEHLSCLMDGEISRETSRFLVRRLGADDELCATWARYHVVRDCLRHQEGEFANQDLCGKVRQAIENDAQAPRNTGRNWFRPVAGMAIAASVALMAVVTVDPGSKIAPQSGSAVAEREQTVPFTSPQSMGAAPISRQASLSGGGPQDQKMNSYLLRHYQATGTSGKGFVNFVPVVVTRDAAAEQVPEADESLTTSEKSEDALAQ